MTVRELVAILANMPQDLPVYLYDNEYDDEYPIDHSPWLDGGNVWHKPAQAWPKFRQPYPERVLIH